MRKIRILILMTTLVFMCLSCDKKTRYYHVSKIDREMIPYQKGDTVRFINERGELVTLVAVEDTRWWEPYDEALYEEYLRVRLKSDTSEYCLSLGVQGFNYGSPDNRTLSLSISACVTELQYNSVGNFITWAGTTVYDSVSIGDHIYYNVAKGIIYASEGTYLGYYNKPHGLLQMTKDRDTVFTLDTVIFAGAR